MAVETQAVDKHQPLEAQTLAVAAVAEVQTLTPTLLQEQVVQASSSSNTKHLLNPYSHSKVLASGLHLLA
jgi:hypothetical protein